MEVLEQVPQHQEGPRASLRAACPREATLRQHCAAVTKSMSNCIRLQLYSSERLSLSGSLCETTRRRAHPGTHTDGARARADAATRSHGARTRARARARWINSKHGQSQRYRCMRRERKSKNAFTLSASSWGLSSPYILLFLRIY